MGDDDDGRERRVPEWRSASARPHTGGFLVENARAFMAMRCVEYARRMRSRKRHVHVLRWCIHHIGGVNRLCSREYEFGEHCRFGVLRDTF